MIVNLKVDNDRYFSQKQEARTVSFAGPVKFSADCFGAFLTKDQFEKQMQKPAFIPAAKPIAIPGTKPAVVPEINPEIANEKESILSNKNLTLAAVGVSLIALGIAVYNASARSKLARKMSSFGSSIIDHGRRLNQVSELSTNVGVMENTVKSLSNDITNISTRANEAIGTVTHKADETFKGILSAAQNKGNIISENVKLNGVDFNLATMLNPIDKNSKIGQEFLLELQTQATKNILGFTETCSPRPGQPIHRVVSVELKPFTSVGGLSSVPKEIAEELPKMLTKDTNARLILDTPLYTGKIAVVNGNEIFGVLKNEGGRGDYVYEMLKGSGGDKTRYELKLIDTFKIKLFGGEEETIRIFQHQVLGEAIPVKEVIGTLSSNHIKAIEKLANNQTYETPNFIVKNINNEKTFQRKVTYNLWDNRKFKLDTPLNANPDIYSLTNYSSSLTEREILFNKYIYEHMIKMEEQYGGMLLDKDGSVLLRTDGLILNDWHTGPLAALARLDSVARKYHGAISDETCNRLKNMPIISLIHNNAYDGAIYEKVEVEKLLNVMFGQYAAQIVPNAYTINIYNELAKTGGVDGSLLNALMKNQGVCPLNMLVNYSNSVHPVSKGYAKELLSSNNLGKGFETIYRIRAKLNDRLEKLSDEDLITIAAKNNLKINSSKIRKLTEPTYYGINNGLNKQKNILNDGTIEQLQEVLTKNLTKAESDALVSKYGNSFRSILPETAIDFSNPQEILKWKMHNKKAVLGYYIDSINEAKRAYAADNSKFAGRLSTWAADLTDLTGVTENTPIFVTAGRIDFQKGYETYLKAIVEYVKAAAQRGEKDFPVFQLQGGVDLANSYAKKVLGYVIATKKALIAAGYEQAAKRIVFLDSGKDGKYAISKLVADFNCMASTFEPCGLTHKEFLNMSGAIPVGHDTGGITAGLQDGVTGIFTAYREASKMDEKAANLAKVFERAVDTFRAKDKYANMLAAAKPLDFTWIQQGNPDCSGQKYLEAMKNAGMVLDNVIA